MRQDFPGGWPSDSLNKFSIAGRNAQEEGIWRYIAKLANFRKTSSALTAGKMMQYVPDDGVYVYFRYDSAQTIMVVMNTSKEQKTTAPKKYFERTGSFSKMKNVQTGETEDLQDFFVEAGESRVYELIN